MSISEHSSPPRRSQAMLLVLAVLIVAAALTWRTVLRKPAPPTEPTQVARAAPPLPPSTPEATQIIANALKVYTSCRSYEDTGRITTVYQEQHRFDSVKTFKTAFVRPDRFFFEYTTTQGTPQDLYAAWSAGKQTRCWWSRDPGIKICDNRYIAMERARAYSEGVAQTVTRLLDPSIGKWSLKELKGVQVTGAEPVDGRACDKLEGVGPFEEKVTVWIDKESSLLRKLRQVRPVRGTETAESTEVFTPQINQPVEAKTFAFTPPKA